MNEEWQSKRKRVEITMKRKCDGENEGKCQVTLVNVSTEFNL